MAESKYLQSQKFRYLIAGLFNTAFGYSVVIALHKILPGISMIIVGIIASFITITVSFLTFRFFVFKSRNNWWKEYIKCYVVYSGVNAINILGFWLIVDVGHLSVWIAPFILMPVCFLFSYLSHTQFTFSNRYFTR